MSESTKQNTERHGCGAIFHAREECGGESEVRHANRSRLTYAVVYMDNGPKGACGQDCVTTSEHTRVYLFDTEDEMREWLKVNYDKMPKRKNSRVTCCYPKGDVVNYAYNNGLEWPSNQTDL